MNAAQRKILLLAATIITLMLLFPPFASELAAGSKANKGFAFLFSSPEAEYGPDPIVNVLQLLGQWVGVCLIGGIFYFIAGKSPESTTDYKRIAIHLLHSLGAGYRKSRVLMWILIAMVVTSLVLAENGNAAAKNLIGKGGAAIIIYMISFAWHAVRAALGIQDPAPEPESKPKGPRVALILTVSAVLLLILVGFGTGHYKVPTARLIYDDEKRPVGSFVFDDEKPQVGKFVPDDEIARPSTNSGGRDLISEQQQKQSAVDWNAFTPVQKPNQVLPPANPFDQFQTPAQPSPKTSP